MNLTRRPLAGPVTDPAICPGATVKQWIWLPVAVTPEYGAARTRALGRLKNGA